MTTFLWARQRSACITSEPQAWCLAWHLGILQRHLHHRCLSLSSHLRRLEQTIVSLLLAFLFPDCQTASAFYAFFLLIFFPPPPFIIFSDHFWNHWWKSFFILSFVALAFTLLHFFFSPSFVHSILLMSHELCGWWVFKILSVSFRRFLLCECCLLLIVLKAHASAEWEVVTSSCNGHVMFTLCYSNLCSCRYGNL